MKHPATLRLAQRIKQRDRDAAAAGGRRLLQQAAELHAERAAGRRLAAAAASCTTTSSGQICSPAQPQLPLTGQEYEDFVYPILELGIIANTSSGPDPNVLATQYLTCKTARELADSASYMCDPVVPTTTVEGAIPAGLVEGFAAGAFEGIGAGAIELDVTADVTADITGAVTPVGPGFVCKAATKVLEWSALGCNILLEIANFQGSKVHNTKLSANVVNLANTITGINTVSQQSLTAYSTLRDQAAANQAQTTAGLINLGTLMDSGQAQVTDGLGTILAQMATNQAALMAQLDNITADINSISDAQAAVRNSMLERFCESANELQVEAKYLRRLMLTPEGDRPNFGTSYIIAAEECTPPFSYGFCADPANTTYTAVKPGNMNCTAGL